MNFPGFELLISISRFSRSSGNPMKYRGQDDEGMKNQSSFFNAYDGKYGSLFTTSIYSLHKSHQNLPRIIKRLMSDIKPNEAFC